MRIALDAMGGDHAPGPIVAGAVEAVRDQPDLTVVLVGDQRPDRGRAGQGPRRTARPPADRPRQPGRRHGGEARRGAAQEARQLDLEVLGPDGRAARSRRSSRPGNTGAMVASALFNAKMFLPGVRRPGIAAIFPSHQGPDRHHRRRRQHERQGRGPVPVRRHGGDLRRDDPRRRRPQDRPAERRHRGRQGDRPDQGDPRPLPEQPAGRTGSSATSRGATSTRGTPGSSSARGSSATSCSRRARGPSSSSSPTLKQEMARLLARRCRPRPGQRSRRGLKELKTRFEYQEFGGGPLARHPRRLHHLPRLVAARGRSRTRSGSPARWPRTRSTT